MKVFQSIIITGFIAIVIVLIAAVSFTQKNLFQTEIPSASIDEGDVTMSDGIRIHYWLYNRHTPTVTVYLHGGPGGNTAVRRGFLGDRIADIEGSVLFFDQRGSGLSEQNPPLSSITFERFVSDIHELITDVVPSHAIIIHGESFGGQLAVHYAQTNPDHAIAFILGSPPLSGKLTAEGQTAIHSDETQKIYAEGILCGSAKAEELGVTTTEDGADQKEDIKNAFSTNENYANREDMALLDAPALQSVPVLVISGDKDIIVPPLENEAMKSHLPNAQFVEIKNAGHGLTCTNTDEYLNALKQFYTNIGS